MTIRIRKLVLNEVAKKYPSQFEAVGALILEATGDPSLAKTIKLLIPLPLFLISIVALLTLAWPWPIIFLWQRVLVIAANPILRTVGVILLLLSGLLLYLARTYVRPIYGLVEVLIGIATCWVGLSNPSAQAISASFAVVGGVYIIIRGFDNIVDDRSLTDPFISPAAVEERRTQS
jgi:hypothetical protein